MQLVVHKKVFGCASLAGVLNTEDTEGTEVKKGWCDEKTLGMTQLVVHKMIGSVPPLRAPDKLRQQRRPKGSVPSAPAKDVRGTDKKSRSKSRGCKS
jgi:hypothetical protein